MGSRVCPDKWVADLAGYPAGFRGVVAGIGLGVRNIGLCPGSFRRVPNIRGKQHDVLLALRTIVRTYTQDMEGMSTAKAARLGGVNVETIRYYERHGLVPKPPRTRAGYRIFSDDAVKRLQFIK